MSEDVHVFRRSLNRCVARVGFLQRFYDLFMGSSEEVRQKFAHTDFERQRRVLADSLFVLAVAAQGQRKGVAWKQLDTLAERHSRRDLDIRPGLYDQWIDSLIDAVAETDPEFDPEVEAAWRRMLALGVDHMKARY